MESDVVDESNGQRPLHLYSWEEFHYYGHWQGAAQRSEGSPFLGGDVFEDAKLEWVTEKVVLRHMTRSAIGVESSGKDRLKRRRMSLNIELECKFVIRVFHN
jgi:hypothetical protein